MNVHVFCGNKQRILNANVVSELTPRKVAASCFLSHKNKFESLYVETQVKYKLFDTVLDCTVENACCRSLFAGIANDTVQYPFGKVP